MNFSHLDKDLYGNPIAVTNPTVSVCIISYNHENYVKKCLDNVFSQKVNFEYEVIMGDDCSTDQTAELIKPYADQYPEKMKAFLRPQNVGAKSNFLHCFLQCRGKYIVFVEADDYWTDNEKLQKQVDFLEQHPGASACFHNAEMIFEDGTKRPSQLINPPNQKTWIQTSDFLIEKETWFMATAAVMMRREFVHPLPAWFAHSKSGDIPMYVILAEQGPIGYLPDVMSVYRKNSGGISMTDHIHSDAFIQNRIFMYSKINEFTHYKYNHLLKPILQAYYLMRRECHEHKANWLKKAYFFSQATLLNPPKNFRAWKSYFKQHLLHPETLHRYLEFRSKLNQILGR